MKKIKIQPTSSFWIIARFCDVSGYQTGTEYDDIELVEFENAKEMSDFIENESVSSGESAGEYIFRILSRSYGSQMLEGMIQDEIDQEEYDKQLDRENEEYYNSSEKEE